MEYLNEISAQYHHLLQAASTLFSLVISGAACFIAWGSFRIAKSNFSLAKENQKALAYKISSKDKDLIRNHWKEIQKILFFIDELRFSNRVYHPNRPDEDNLTFSILKKARESFFFLKENAFIIIKDQNLINLLKKTYEEISNLISITNQIELIDCELDQKRGTEEFSNTSKERKNLDIQKLSTIDKIINDDVDNYYKKLKELYANILIK